MSRAYNEYGPYPFYAIGTQHMSRGIGTRNGPGFWRRGLATHCASCTRRWLGYGRAHGLTHDGAQAETQGGEGSSGFAGRSCPTSSDTRGTWTLHMALFLVNMPSE